MCVPPGCADLVLIAKLAWVALSCLSRTEVCGGLGGPLLQKGWRLSTPEQCGAGSRPDSVAQYRSMGAESRTLSSSRYHMRCHVSKIDRGFLKAGVYALRQLVSRYHTSYVDFVGWMGGTCMDTNEFLFTFFGAWKQALCTHVYVFHFPLPFNYIVCNSVFFYGMVCTYSIL